MIWCKDYLNLPTDVFAIMEKDLRPKRDLFKRFLRAYKKGAEWTIKNPEEAVQYCVKVCVDTKDPKLILDHVKIRVIGSSQSATTRQKGLGWFDMPVLKDGADLYRKAGLIKEQLNIETIFSNEIVQEL